MRSDYRSYSEAYLWNDYQTGKISLQKYYDEVQKLIEQHPNPYSDIL